ncbi:MAG: cyclase family protein [Holdemanella sp.]
MDPPAHIFANRKTLDQFSPEQFIGKALVVDCRDLKEGQAITIDKINIDKAKLADFLFFNLGWDKHFKDETYFNDFPYNSKGNFKGIGFDVMGLDPLRDNNLNRHKALFKNTDIVNIENLTNLDQCGNDLFWSSCFPLKIENCEGFPIRAIAWYE